jgi:hypothetical protein
MVLRVNLGRMALLVLKAFQVFQAKLVSLGFRVHQAKACKDHLVHQDLQDLQGMQMKLINSRTKHRS